MPLGDPECFSAVAGFARGEAALALQVRDNTGGLRLTPGRWQDPHSLWHGCAAHQALAARGVPWIRDASLRRECNWHFYMFEHNIDSNKQERPSLERVGSFLRLLLQP